MTTLTCDLCNGDGKPLIDLRDMYQTEKIKQICPDCETKVNAALSEMRLVASKFVSGSFRTFLENLWGKFHKTSESRGAKE